MASASAILLLVLGFFFWPWDIDADPVTFIELWAGRSWTLCGAARGVRSPGGSLSRFFGKPHQDWSEGRPENAAVATSQGHRAARGRGREARFQLNEQVRSASSGWLGDSAVAAANRRAPIPFSSCRNRGRSESGLELEGRGLERGSFEERSQFSGVHRSRGQEARQTSDQSFKSRLP